MKLRAKVFLSRVDDEFVAVATGEAGKNFSGMVRMNETSAFVLNCLRKRTNLKKLTAALMARYDVSEEEAQRNIEHVLAGLRTAGWLEE